jgi:hypothetical protein
MGLTLTRAQAIQMFKKIGAVIDEGGCHNKVSLEIEGKKVFMTVLSRGTKEIPTGTAKSIFRELCLSNNVDHCIELRNCPMKRNDYIGLLKQAGVL